MRTLIHLSYSPWSEKARWALDHHGVHVERREHLPMLAEPWLRLRTRRFTGRVTVPVLVGDDGRVLFDSFDIARWADQQGRGTTLFPRGAEHEVAVWNDWSERLLASGRARTTARAATRPDVLEESVPPPLSAVPLLAAPAGRLGVRFLRRKYRFSDEQAEYHAGVLRAGLTALRQGLSGRETLGESFSYADIAMAVGLAFIAPVADRWAHLGPASRAAWTEPELAEEFADLVTWRNRTYERERDRKP